MGTNLSQVEQRVRRYWYTDGIAELAGGGMLLLIGLYFSGQEWLPRGSFARSLLEASLALLLIGGALLTRRLVNALKLRLTYPRTGYVEYPAGRKDTTSRRLLTGGIAAAVAALLVLAGRWVGSFDWMTAFTGIVFAIVFTVLRARASGLHRFYILGGFCLVLGLGLSFSGLPMGYSLGLLYALTGVASMLSGGITLARYLRSNPMPPEQR
jgi:hypothetical protein